MLGTSFYRFAMEYIIFQVKPTCNWFSATITNPNNPGNLRYYYSTTVLISKISIRNPVISGQMVHEKSSHGINKTAV